MKWNFRVSGYGDSSNEETHEYTLFEETPGQKNSRPKRDLTTLTYALFKKTIQSTTATIVGLQNAD